LLSNACCYGLLEFLRVKFHGTNFVDGDSAAFFNGLRDGCGADVIEVVEVNVVFAYLWTKSVYVSQPPCLSFVKSKISKPTRTLFSRASRLIIPPTLTPFALGHPPF